MEDPTMTTDHPSATTAPTATPTVSELLAAIVDLCETYARAETGRALAEHAGTKAERDDLVSRAAYFNRESRTRYDALTTAIEAVLPRTAQVETFLPVRTLPDGRVEIHAVDQHERPVVVALTGTEAVTVGVHLTAYAAIGLDRTGTKLDRILPPLFTDPPTATTASVTPSVPVISGAHTPAA
jgi:hypothetical protein